MNYELMRKWIEITTYLPCVNKCSYCPQSKLMRAYKGQKRMNLKTFEQILANIPLDVEIHFSGFSEPYGHPDIEEFFKLASSHKVALYTSVGKKPEIELVEYCHNPVDSVQNPISRASHNWKIEERKGCQCRRSPEFKQNVCLPNGDVYLCCMDYGLDHKLGNSLNTNFNDLQRKQSYELCRFCEDYL